jgi:hypothetical protein
MTEPVAPLLTPADFDEFASTVSTAKRQQMIDDALGLAQFHAPCITTEGFAHRAAAKAIVRGAILRWIEAGNGAAVSQQASIYAQTVDTRQPRRSMFLKTEISDLKALCRTEDDDTGAFSFDMIPPTTIEHADICSIHFGGDCSCGAILTQGLPLYETNGWA